jgi:hypothetical protein
VSPSRESATRFVRRVAIREHRRCAGDHCVERGAGDTSILIAVLARAWSTAHKRDTAAVPVLRSGGIQWREGSLEAVSRYLLLFCFHLAANSAR